MAPGRTLFLKVACGLFIVLLASCDSVEVHRRPKRGPGPGIGHGPPAHARAHGYRRKQVCGYDLIYDSGRGVYIVVGVSDCYYHEGHFYRLCGDAWQISLHADNDWAPVAFTALPSGLRVKTKASAPAKEKGRAEAKGYAKGQGRGKGHAKDK